MMGQWIDEIVEFGSCTIWDLLTKTGSGSVVAVVLMPPMPREADGGDDHG
jgi:hypothetical protein